MLSKSVNTGKQFIYDQSQKRIDEHYVSYPWQSIVNHSQKTPLDCHHFTELMQANLVFKRPFGRVNIQCVLDAADLPRKEHNFECRVL